MSVPDLKRSIDVGDCGSSRVNRGSTEMTVVPVFLGLHHPFHGDGMVFGSIAAHDQEGSHCF